MALHKLLLDDDLREDFSLVAVHCSEEAYKMAYLLNRYLALQLKRKPVDLDFSNDGLEVTFPIFEYENALKYSVFHLVSNKCKSITAKLQSSGGLFGEQDDEKMVWTYLLPEFRNVDFLLKIESVISAYAIEPDSIRSKNNLIFD